LNILFVDIHVLGPTSRVPYTLLSRGVEESGNFNAARLPAHLTIKFYANINSPCILMRVFRVH